MKVKYLGGCLIALVRGQVYDVASIEGEWYRIVDEPDKSFLYPPCAFEITEADGDDVLVLDW